MKITEETYDSMRILIYDEKGGSLVKNLKSFNTQTNVGEVYIDKNDKSKTEFKWFPTAFVEDSRTTTQAQRELDEVIKGIEDNSKEYVEIADKIYVKNIDKFHLESIPHMKADSLILMLPLILPLKSGGLKRTAIYHTIHFEYDLPGDMTKETMETTVIKQGLLWILRLLNDTVLCGNYSNKNKLHVELDLNRMDEVRSFKDRTMYKKLPIETFECPQKCESCDRTFELDTMISGSEDYFCQECWKALYPELTESYNDYVKKQKEERWKN